MSKKSSEKPFKIIVNGKECTEYAHTARMAVCGITCWYGSNTIFTVISPTYEASVFKLIPNNDPVCGYRELVDYIEYLHTTETENT